MIVSLMKIGSLLTALALPFTQKVALERPTQTEQASDKNFFSFKMKGIDGKEIDFSQFKGKKSSYLIQPLNVDIHHHTQIGKLSTKQILKLLYLDFLQMNLEDKSQDPILKLHHFA